MNYSDLQARVLQYLAGQVPSDLVPGFIELAEAELSRLLYGNGEEKRSQATTTPGNPRVVLPPDCRRIRTLRYVGMPGGALSYATPANLDALGAVGGRPGLYTIEANALRFSPTPDTAYTVEVIYQQGIPALSDLNPTNDVLSRHPDAYLHATLMQAYDHLMDEPRADKARARLEQIVGQIVLENERIRFPGPIRRRAYQGV